MTTNQLRLSDALSGTYKSKKKSAEMMAKTNYLFDPELSNIQSRVYFNHDENKLLVTFRGTKNILNDVPTDLAIATGTLPLTERYMSSKIIYDKAKNKYMGAQTTVLGDSLGGSLASAIGQKDDKIVTFNKGAGILEPITKSKSNEKGYSWAGDIVSGLTLFNSNQKRIGNLKNPLSAHDYSNLESIKPIYI
jgi:hypothetical protein